MTRFDRHLLCEVCRVLAVVGVSVWAFSIFAVVAGEVVAGLAPDLSLGGLRALAALSVPTVLQVAAPLGIAVVVFGLVERAELDAMYQAGVHPMRVALCLATPAMALLPLLSDGLHSARPAAIAERLDRAFAVARDDPAPWREPSGRMAALLPLGDDAALGVVCEDARSGPTLFGGKLSVLGGGSRRFEAEFELLDLRVTGAERSLASRVESELSSEFLSTRVGDWSVARRLLASVDARELAARALEARRGAPWFGLLGVLCTLLPIFLRPGMRRGRRVHALTAGLGICVAVLVPVGAGG